MSTDDGFELGPFNGGLNQSEDSRVIDDSQLAICRNMDVGRAGELSIRPGLKRPHVFPTNTYIVGSALRNDNKSRAFGVESATNNIVYKDGTAITDTTAWTSSGITAAGKTEKVVQYSNSAWFIPKGAGAIGVRQALDTNAFTTLAGMPRGSGAVIFKDRLFIFGPVDETNTVTQRIYYSAATDFTSFPAANFFDINPGDGEGVTAAIAVADTLIFFKRHSTWALFYDSDPGLGILRKVNPEIGATGPNSVVAFENVVYVVDERTVYQIQNLLFTDIGKNIALRLERQNMTFTSDNQDFVASFGSKILVIVYTGQAVPFEYYVYSTEIEAWTEYTFAEQPTRLFSILSSVGFRDYIGSKAGSPNLYLISPFRTDDAAFGDYPFGATPVLVRTKKYGGGPSSKFKRLFWWGLEVKTNGTVKMQATAAGGVSSTEAVLTGSNNFQFLKAFSPQRFRYIEFSLSSDYSNLRLEILSGVAYLGRNKSEVPDAVNA